MCEKLTYTKGQFKLAAWGALYLTAFRQMGTLRTVKTPVGSFFRHSGGHAPS